MIANNEASKLVAQTIRILDEFNSQSYFDEIQNAIEILEKTLEILINNK